ncbi:MAG: CAAX prenyl protease-related protein [Acidobacteria bacterium]|nr:CAAX prenyl protease-related protein [Acidobacteriota bacterium]
MAVLSFAFRHPPTMSSSPRIARPGPAASRSPDAVPYVAGFLAYVGFLAVEGLLPLPQPLLYGLRVSVSSAVILAVARPLASFRATRPFSSVLVGVTVFGLWVAPDLIFPGYRQHWLFQNALTGKLSSSLEPGLRSSFWFLLLRAAGSALVVPVAEELFWRGWLLRWLIRPQFTSVPLGAFAPGSFWLVAVLFASEHGPFWDVGLAAGIAYNWWMVRAKSLPDLILAHGVTNACLAAYVIAAGQWSYWL